MPDERRYNEREVAEIVRLATEGKAVPANDGMTLAEIQAVVAELGLDATSVQVAANKVAAGLPEVHESGPNFEFLRTYDGEVDDANWEEIVLLMRRKSGTNGEVTVRGTTREWSSSIADLGTFHLTATVKDGRTRVRLARDISGGLVLMWIVSFLPILLGPVILLAKGGKWGIPTPWPLILAGILTTIIFAAVTMVNRRQKKNARDLVTLLDEIEPLIKSSDAKPSLQTATVDQEDNPRLRLGQTE